MMNKAEAIIYMRKYEGAIMESTEEPDFIYKIVDGRIVEKRKHSLPNSPNNWIEVKYEWPVPADLEPEIPSTGWQKYSPNEHTNEPKYTIDDEFTRSVYETTQQLARQIKKLCLSHEALREKVEQLVCQKNQNENSLDTGE